MCNKFESFRSLINERWFSQMRDHPVDTDLLKIVRSPLAPITEIEFKWHLADAILNKRFSVEEYERITDLDFETCEEVAADLAQLWQQVFKGEQIALPMHCSVR
jgi:hypothetical protein